MAATTGCTRFHTEKGIEPAWHDIDPDTLSRDASTQTHVMEFLGLRSQIISQEDDAIFYYLHEEAVGTG